MTPVEMSDSQLLLFSKGLHSLETEASNLVEDTLAQKEKYVEAVRKEVDDRDLSEENIKNAQGLKIQLPKFKGHESPMDIHTFKGYESPMDIHTFKGYESPMDMHTFKGYESPMDMHTFKGYESPMDMHTFKGYESPMDMHTFKGYESPMDIYTFKGYESPMDIHTFIICKFVKPYVQKTLLPGTLKLYYLGDRTLTLVKQLKDIDEIWERLTNSYGNARVLLYNKLGAFSKSGGLEKIRVEKLSHGISGLLNEMSELSELAKKIRSGG